MTESSESIPEKEQKIVILKGGPYNVRGGVRLLRLTQIVSELGEPLRWENNGEIPTPNENYILCRCGQSAKKPFCDGTHRAINFQGREVAVTDHLAGRRVTWKGNGDLIVDKNIPLCMSSGFCYTVDTGIDELTERAADPSKRAQAIGMVENCPSGSLTYRLVPGGPEVEQDLPMQVAETIEITSYGPIEGPLWVMGYLPIERADGMPFLPRNRVTLCNCGRSSNMPLCDGTHRYLQENELRKKARQK